jgi:hypothetical protein
MRVVLADLKGKTGFVSKDTVVGGYGSRLRPFSRVSAVMATLKRRLHAPPSVQMAYLAALAPRDRSPRTAPPGVPVSPLVKV